jgi:hypothetical protein
MAFAQTVTIKGSKYTYKLNANVKIYTLRDNFFVKTKAGNFEFKRPLESTPHAHDGGILKIIVSKDLTGIKLSIVSYDEMRKIDIFQDQGKMAVQEQFYFIMDDLIDRGVLDQV